MHGGLYCGIHKDTRSSLQLLQASSITESGISYPSRSSSVSIDSRMEEIKSEERSSDNHLLHPLKQALGEAENLKREALEEMVRHLKAEKSAIEPICKVTTPFLQQDSCQTELQQLLQYQGNSRLLLSLQQTA
ncbi:hypothetical protein ACOSP7_005997 [Xanthoceras sorbifolium]